MNWLAAVLSAMWDGWSPLPSGAVTYGLRHWLRRRALRYMVKGR